MGGGGKRSVPPRVVPTSVEGKVALTVEDEGDVEGVEEQGGVGEGDEEQGGVGVGEEEEEEEDTMGGSTNF
jgi:hypothetical protein